MKCPKCSFKWVSTIRSNPQNNFYWGVCIELLSEHLGFTPEEVHNILKHKFLDGKTLSVATKNGIEKIWMQRSTTELTTGEFKNYIEQIQRWASIELGIVIPDPNEIINGE